jgi:hypothetical protein
LKNDDHKLVMLLALIVNWGGTGAVDSGIGPSYSLLTPIYYFGKGFGDLSDSAGWLSAFAVAGRLSDPYGVVRSDPEYVHTAGPHLRCFAAIQHAVSEIADRRPATSPIGRMDSTQNDDDQ